MVWLWFADVGCWKLFQFLHPLSFNKKHMFTCVLGSLFNTQTDAHKNNNRQSIPTADYPFRRCPEGQITHVTVADGVSKRRHCCLSWWFSRVKLPQVLYAPPWKQTANLCVHFYMDVDGKCTMITTTFFFTKRKEKIKITYTHWFFSMCQHAQALQRYLATESTEPGSQLS